MYIILRSYQWENKSRNPIILWCPGTPIKLSTIQNIIFSSDKKQKKQPLWEHSLLILIKTFFKNEILRGSLISQKIPRSAGGVCIKPKQHLADRARLIFCSKFLAPGEGNQTCQVRGGTSPPPPLPSVDYHTGVMGIKWSLATVIGPSNYVTNWP